MSDDHSVDIELRATAAGPVAFIVINRPHRSNALSSSMMEASADQIERLASNTELRALVLTGAGEKAFIGGADINEMAAFENAKDARRFITRVHRFCEALRSLPVPTIARINGSTFGAGMELAAACDVRVAADTAMFGMPEVRLGIPSVVEAALLPQLIGWGRTRELLLFGETFSAAEALTWGFVERVAPAADLDAAVDHWLGQLARCSPGAVRLQKKLIRAWEDLPLRASVAAGIDAFEVAAEGEEPALAMAAHLARRRSDNDAGSSSLPD